MAGQLDHSWVNQLVGQMVDCLEQLMVELKVALTDSLMVWKLVGVKDS